MTQQTESSLLAKVLACLFLAVLFFALGVDIGNGDAALSPWFAVPIAALFFGAIVADVSFNAGYQKGRGER